MARRSFVAALALYDSVDALTHGAASLALKWPNDMLLNGGKLAGILLETLGPDRLAIGIGVNLRHAPDAEGFEARAMAPVCLFDEAAIDVTPQAFLDVLAHNYAQYETQFQAHGFAPIRLAWLARAAKLGEAIVARTGREELRGTFTDIDAEGMLVLNTRSGLKHVPAADIYF